MKEAQLEIITLSVGQLRTNCYLVVDKKSLDVLLIDPGDAADFIERIISDRKLNPKAIIATHGHFDHILAVTELKLAYQIPFLMHKDDQFLLKKMRESAKRFCQIETDVAPDIDCYLADSQKISLGTSLFNIITTPGHTPGSICFYCKKEKILFTGDLLFASGIGRTDFSYSSLATMKLSLKRIFRLAKETRIYPGHGESSILKLEQTQTRDLL